MFNSLRQDGGWISPGSQGYGNFRDDEIVSCAPANVACEVRAFKSLIFQSNTNASSKSHLLRLAASFFYLFILYYTSNTDTWCQNACQDIEQEIKRLLREDPN